MKITKQQLKQIIKEELKSILKEAKLTPPYTAVLKSGKKVRITGKVKGSDEFLTKNDGRIISNEIDHKATNKLNKSKVTKENVDDEEWTYGRFRDVPGYSEEAAGPPKKRVPKPDLKRTMKQKKGKA